ncbi:MAG: hypothetical protein NTY48_01425, partial [Candidatus Diapherotrites archaeon]|nr:hypothetical protein [Candidatus Diapherotrites archaeon]
NYFLGEGFAKSRLMFLKFGGDFEFCPRGGRVWEGIRAGFCFLGFFGELFTNKVIYVKLFILWINMRIIK